MIDRRSGRILNANLAEYHVPVNADVPSLEALMIEEHDPHVNALGIKGVGEIGITGSAGAVANAVWHATGIRVRRFPIRIEDLVMGGAKIRAWRCPVFSAVLLAQAIECYRCSVDGPDSAARAIRLRRRLRRPRNI